MLMGIADQQGGWVASTVVAKHAQPQPPHVAAALVAALPTTVLLLQVRLAGCAAPQLAAAASMHAAAQVPKRMVPWCAHHAPRPETRLAALQACCVSAACWLEIVLACVSRNRRISAALRLCLASYAHVGEVLQGLHAAAGYWPFDVQHVLLCAVP